MMFNNVFKDKKVLITGNSGFKGAWLTIWLCHLGANVVGVSDKIPTNPSHFKSAKLEKLITQYWLDVKNLPALQGVFDKEEPDFVFHLAAQALVRHSYAHPVETIATNTIGTANVLEALRKLSKPVVAVMITSDKVYKNVEWKWGYREIDDIGGKDPYSASKGMAEFAINTYLESFFADTGGGVSIGIARAGNVIGGGDWAADRIVPDCIRAWLVKEKVLIRNPRSTRPWQHVLEPLSGYLALAAELSVNSKLHGEAYNFGPAADQDIPVYSLIDEMSKHWDNVSYEDVSEPHNTLREAGLLKLNCDKALYDLHWQPTLDFADTVKLTIEWYREVSEQKKQNMLGITTSQVEVYQEKAKRLGLSWAN